MFWIDDIGAGLALVMAGAAAWTDLRTGRIPNGLTVSGLVTGFSCGLAAHGPHGLVAAAVGALVVGLIPLLLFRFSALGGGDVKLLAALGALLGARLGLEVEITAFGLGALEGLVLWLWRGELRHGLARVLRLVTHPLSATRGAEAGGVVLRTTEIRFAPAILVAAAVVIARALVW